MRNLVSLAVVAVVLAVYLPALPSFALENQYTEDFTTTLYKDAPNTTANWDTAAGELGLFPFTLSPPSTYDTTGEAYDVAVSGDYAYVADDASGLSVFDITDPMSPTFLGNYNTPGYAYGVAVSGDYAYVTDYTYDLKVIDITNPTNPTLHGTFDVSGITREITILGDYAFVAAGTTGLLILDISDPARPTALGSYNTIGNAMGIAVAGDQVFIADGTGGLCIVHIFDPATPLFEGRWDPAGFIRDVEVAGDYAFVAASELGLYVIDISDTGNPAIAAFCATPGDPWRLTVSGDYVYMGDGIGGLQVIDISDPTHPVLLTGYDTPAVARGVTVSGNYAFLADGASGLNVFEIADAMAPTLLGSYLTSSTARGVAVSGDLAFVADGNSGLQVLDISDPISPTLLGSYNTPSTAMDVAASGEYVFVADHYAGVHVLYTIDPTNPVLLGTCDTPNSASGLAVSGDYVFVADASSGFHVIDISDAGIPVIIGSFNTPGVARSVYVSGDYAYVADGLSGLYVLDISDPTNPTFLGVCNTPAEALAVSVAGDYAFVADYYSGLQVINISHPTSPTLVATCPTPGIAYGVTIAGDYAFVADHTAGLAMVDISNPVVPTLVGTCDTPNLALDVTVAGDHAFVADYNSGIQTIMISQRGFDLGANIGRSLFVDESDDAIISVNLTAEHEGAVAWELSTDLGTSWQNIAADGSWLRMTAPGNDLIWRSTHAVTSPRVNPVVSSLTLAWLNEFAPIVAITDVPGDQGGMVDVTINRSGYDFVGETSLPVTGYNIYRRVDGAALVAKGLALSRVPDEQALQAPSGASAWPLPGAKVIKSGADSYVIGSASIATTASLPPGTWKLVATAFATQSDTYIVEATTSADSSTTGIDWSVYLVTTHTTTPSVWYASQPDSGYSVDNIAPGVPTAIAAAYQADGVTLDWDDAPEIDFQYYRVYRGTDPGFAPATDNLVQEVAASTWTDPTTSPWGYFFKITVLDFAGNESEAGSPESVSGVAGGVLPTRTTLLGSVPNPFNPSTRLSFELATAGHARLAVYDVAGRLVRTLVDEHRDIGRYGVVWDGRDMAGRVSGAGVYLYRFEAGGVVDTKRGMLIK